MNLLSPLRVPLKEETERSDFPAALKGLSTHGSRGPFSTMVSCFHGWRCFHGLSLTTDAASKEAGRYGTKVA